jgi:hypothetical protein
MKLGNFLIENKKSSSPGAGFNALKLMYHLSQREQYSSNEADMSQFSKYDIGDSSNNEKGNVQFLQSYLNIYSEEYKYDPSICSLILSYFSPTLNKSFKEYLVNKSIPYQSFIEYAEMQLGKLANNDSNKLNDRTMVDIFQHLSSIFKKKLLEKSSDERESFFNNQIVLIRSIYSLIKKLIKKFSKEVNIIIEYITIYLSVAMQRIRKNKNDNDDKDMDDFELESDPIRDIMELIEKWYGKECNESLLFNFGVQRRSEKELAEHEREMANEKKSLNFDKLEDELEGVVGFPNIKLHERLGLKRQIEYWGITNEFEIYSSVLDRNFSRMGSKKEKNLESIFKIQMINLFEKRISSRMWIDLDEVIQFRVRFDSSMLGNKTEFEKIVDNLICKKLKEEVANDLKQVCYSLREKTEKNQNRLQYYITEFLASKWPATKDKFTILEFAIKWSLFIELEACQLDHVYKNYSLPLDSKWIQSFNNVLGHFMQSVEEIVNGSATIQIVKLFHVNLKDTYKLVEFFVSRNLSGKLPINKSNLIIFKSLIEIRMRECLEFERYRSNLKAFVQFCNNFKQVNVKAYEKQLASLGKMENLDKETKLNSICAIKNFEHDITDELIKIIDEKRQLEKIEETKPKITYFLNINLTNMPTIDEIINLNRSCCVIFDSYFSDACDKVKELHIAKNKDINELNIEHVINEVWPMARNRWQKVTTVIQNGKIKLVELDEMLKAYFKENYSKMQTELIYMNDYFKIQNLNLRNEQIK